MVKALAFKGDKKALKKRKRMHDGDGDGDGENADASASKLLVATDAPPADDENWVSVDALADVAGPVMFVLATEPVTSLSVDQLGEVFAQAVENMVEGQEHLTAEPHDVRQVWIATRVVGSEHDFTFKGHHGRYLGCDRYGICSATTEAISPEETFQLHPTADAPGVFDVRSARDTYLTVDAGKSPVEVRGDMKEAGETTRVRIRMQARFKPKHKVEKAEKVRAKISRKELEGEVGLSLIHI